MVRCPADFQRSISRFFCQQKSRALVRGFFERGGERRLDSRHWLHLAWVCFCGLAGGGGEAGVEVGGESTGREGGGGGVGLYGHGEAVQGFVFAEFGAAAVYEGVGDLADGLGAGGVAEGVEVRADGAAVA